MSKGYFLVQSCRFGSNTDNSGQNDIYSNGNFSTSCIDSCSADTVPVNMCTGCTPTKAPTPPPTTLAPTKAPTKVREKEAQVAMAPSTPRQHIGTHPTDCTCQPTSAGAVDRAHGLDRLTHQSSEQGEHA